MHNVTPRTVALGTVLLAAVVPAASAQAASITLNQPCQIATFGLTATLAGFTPNSTVTLDGDGIFRTVTADAVGSATVTFAAPLLGSSLPKSKQFIVNAADDAPAPLRAFARFRSTNLAFGTTGGVRSPKAKRTWTFSGLQPGKPIWGHFRFGGRTRGTYRFGIAEGPCGELTVKAPGIPVKGRINTGRWNIQIDQQKIFNPATKPRMTGSTSVVVVYKS
jgi:hypothetical protein